MHCRADVLHLSVRGTDTAYVVVSAEYMLRPFEESSLRGDFDRSDVVFINVEFTSR